MKRLRLHANEFPHICDLDSPCDNPQAELLERLRQHARGQIAIPVPNEARLSAIDRTKSSHLVSLCSQTSAC